LSTETPTPAAEAPPARRACVVLLGGRPFAVDVTDAQEVVVLRTTTPVPGAPPTVLGVMNLRGSIMPIVEARPLLGLPMHTRSDRALVLADGDRRAAVVIEGVLGLAALDTVESAADAGALTLGAVALETGGRATLLDARGTLAAVRRAWDAAREGHDT
jgi:purine-binding chemotaxis protein CheW